MCIYIEKDIYNIIYIIHIYYIYIIYNTYIYIYYNIYIIHIYYNIHVCNMISKNVLHPMAGTESPPAGLPLPGKGSQVPMALT